jgi:hypothetical protein
LHILSRIGWRFSIKNRQFSNIAAYFFNHKKYKLLPCDAMTSYDAIWVALPNLHLSTNHAGMNYYTAQERQPMSQLQPPAEAKRIHDFSRELGIILRRIKQDAGKKSRKEKIPAQKPPKKENQTNDQ